MTTSTTFSILTGLTLAIAAGTVASAIGQNHEQPARTAGAVASTVDFRSSRWLGDRKVVNNNGEEIGSTSELILDRGSGRIEYVVIKSGATLGLGGRAVAIPYGSLRWETGGKDRYVLALTPEQLKQLPEYTPESWKAMKEAAKDDASELHRKLAADALVPGDPYAGTLDTTKVLRVEGVITKVERVRTSTSGEQVVITVETSDKTSRRIALGPSWYVNAAPSAPMRGDKVVVDTLVLPRDPDQLLAGTHLRADNRELHLRETDGAPAWGLKTVESGGQRYSTPYSRYLLLSSLPGAKVDCRGEECGKVNDIIIDRTSGEIGFISIDPNQNFLGIGDTKRLVPWSVATVMLDGTVRIDASKDMVLASPETPSDLATLGSGLTAESAYKAYQVPAPRFEAPKPVAVLSDKDSAWSARGPIITAIDRDSVKTFEGKVVEVTEVKFEKGVLPARALRIKLPGDGGAEELVLLGPASYLDNQKMDWRSGDPIKVEACRTTIDGRPYWLARSVDCKNTRVMLLDGSNVPAWSQR